MWFSAIREVTGQPFFILIALSFLKGRDIGQAIRADSCFWEDWLLPLLDTPIPQLKLLALLVHTLQAWLLPIVLQQEPSAGGQILDMPPQFPHLYGDYDVK